MLKISNAVDLMGRGAGSGKAQFRGQLANVRGGVRHQWLFQIPGFSTLGEVEIPVPEVMAIFSGFPSDHTTYLTLNTVIA